MLYSSVISYGILGNLFKYKQSFTLFFQMLSSFINIIFEWMHRTPTDTNALPVSIGRGIGTQAGITTGAITTELYSENWYTFL